MSWIDQFATSAYLDKWPFLSPEREAAIRTKDPSLLAAWLETELNPHVLVAIIENPHTPKPALLRFLETEVLDVWTIKEEGSHAGWFKNSSVYNDRGLGGEDAVVIRAKHFFHYLLARCELWFPFSPEIFVKVGCLPDAMLNSLLWVYLMEYKRGHDLPDEVVIQIVTGLLPEESPLKRLEQLSLLKEENMVAKAKYGHGQSL